MLNGVTNSPSWSRLKLYSQAILLAELIGVLLLLLASLALPETEGQIVVLGPGKNNGRRRSGIPS